MFWGEILNGLAFTACGKDPLSNLGLGTKKIPPPKKRCRNCKRANTNLDSTHQGLPLIIDHLFCMWDPIPQKADHTGSLQVRGQGDYCVKE